MNQKRLKKIEGALDVLRECAEEEHDQYDNASERWQESERGENSCEWCDALDDAIDALEGPERL